MHLVSGVTGPMLYMANHHRSTETAVLSRSAQQRRRLLEWHASHGQNVSRACRHFGISRSTFYRWQQRYDPRHPQTLENRSCRPRRVRQPSWSPPHVAAVWALREQYPRWGKDKLVVLLARAGVHLSVSMVGRILTFLKRTGQIREPLRRISARKRQRARPHATRKPRDYRVEHPGDLVQLDTLDLRPEPGVVLKQFTAHDAVSRWGVVTLTSTATARAAVRALDALQARLPVPVRAIQVDGGSEFMAEFETACAARQIRLFVLPPRSPNLNGGVERANRTHTEEFYECTTAPPTVAALGTALRRWETVFNTIRPHQALGYRTPAQFLADWQAEQQRKENLSRR
jgi:transposase InsO family protein